MNRKILGFIILILLAIGSSVTYLLINTDGEGTNQEIANQDQSLASRAEPVDQLPAISPPGAYIDYNKSAINDTKGTKLLFFHAPWCPQCRELEADIKSNQLPSDVTIIKVDFDTNQALRQKYGVTIQTTIVRVDDQGNLVNKFVAYDDPSLDAIKQNLL